MGMGFAISPWPRSSLSKRRCCASREGTTGAQAKISVRSDVDELFSLDCGEKLSVVCRARLNRTSGYGSMQLDSLQGNGFRPFKPIVEVKFAGEMGLGGQKFGHRCGCRLPCSSVKMTVNLGGHRSVLVSQVG